jgi:glycosyltransferase involved in cell wall biosynthesis
MFMTLSAAPEVSIILPTYNRADTIGRAVQSVLAQTFEDWELVVVDDGSSDGTQEVLAGIDPRIRVLRQANAGVGAARNTGLAAARGRLLTFLDSDDGWLPHFLELTTSFLHWAPDEQWVTTEFNQDYGHGHVIRHNLDDVPRYVTFARAIDSHRLDLPPGETDDYLRLYQSREAVGDWGLAGLAQAGLDSAYLYRGNLFPQMRWGYLNWLPSTMITRHAFETVGPFVTGITSAECYRFLGLLAKNFRANMIGVPSAVKYQHAVGAVPLKEGHLATGRNSYTFEVNKIAQFGELYADEFASDPELSLIKLHYELDAGFAALIAGKRERAVQHLNAAARWRPRLRQAYPLLALARLSPTDQVAARVMQSWERAVGIAERLQGGHTTMGELGRKASGKLLRGQRAGSA